MTKVLNTFRRNPNRHSECAIAAHHVQFLRGTPYNKGVDCDDGRLAECRCRALASTSVTSVPSVFNVFGCCFCALAVRLSSRLNAECRVPKAAVSRRILIAGFPAVAVASAGSW